MVESYFPNLTDLFESAPYIVVPLISVDQLVYENLSGAYSINAASDADKYATVIVKGVESVLNDIDENSVKVYVDLSGYGPGTHDVDVLVEGNDVRVSYETKVKKVTLIISQRR